MTAGSNMKQHEHIPDNLINWATTVNRLLGNKKEMRRTIRWWKSKNAKAIWGTKGARLRRWSLRKALVEGLR